MRLQSDPDWSCGYLTWTEAGMPLLGAAMPQWRCPGSSLRSLYLRFQRYLFTLSLSISMRVRSPDAFYTSPPKSKHVCHLGPFQTVLLVLG